MKISRRFKTKKTANSNRIRTDEVLKVDLTSVKITFQEHTQVLKSVVLKLKERIKLVTSS